jgi:hypothetical protein
MRQLFTRATTKQRGAPARGALFAAAALAAMVILLGQPAGGHTALAHPAPDGPLVVALTDGGLTPSQATAPAGLVHLRVENRRAGSAAVTLRVTRDGGALVRDIQLPEGSREAATELELAAGTYTLIEVGQPSHSCQLTVQ